MDLFGGPEVEESVSSSVDQVKERREDVEVADLRSPEELISQVDELEEEVEGLRERQNRLFEDHVDDIQDLDEDNSSHSKDGITDVSDKFSSDEFEERLEMLEIAVNRLESGFELEAEEMREKVINDALDIESSKFAEVNERVSNLESKVEELADDKDRIEELEEKVEEMSKLILRLSDQKN